MAFFSEVAVEALDTFQKKVADPKGLLKPSVPLANSARNAAKVLYAHTAARLSAAGAEASHLLPELYTDSFDAEQVWQQICLQYDPLVAKARRQIRKLQKEESAEAFFPEVDTAVAQLGVAARGTRAQRGGMQTLAGLDAEGDDDDDDDADAAAEGSLAAAIKQLRALGGGGAPMSAVAAGRAARADGNSDIEEEEDSEVEDFENEAEAEESDEEVAAGPKRRNAWRPVEDDFLNLDEMEKFVREAEEQGEAADRSGEEGSEAENESSSEEDDDGPVFADPDKDDSENEDALDILPTGDDERADEDDLAAALVYTSNKAGSKKAKEGATKKGSEITYEDFFGPKKRNQRPTKRPPTLDKEEEEEEEESDVDDSPVDIEDGSHGSESSGSDKMDMEEGSSGEESDDDGDGTAAGTAQAEVKSTHELRKERIQKQVAALEAEAMADKQWKMAGEVMATARPKNSALEVDLDFEHVAMPAPVITAEITQSLEDLIKKRIVENRFDDVVRVDPITEPRGRDKIELDDQKSKKGLGDLYEEDFVKAREGPAAEEEETTLQREARALYAALAVRLDALSHFSFAPKPHVEELAVKRKVPALQMEEVAPVAITTADQMAPQDTYKGGEKQGKKAAGDVKGESELTQAERKRDRARRKRAVAHKDAAAGAKKRKALAAKGYNSADVAAVNAAKQAGDALAVDTFGGSSYTKSAKVFGALQDARSGAGAKGKSKAKAGELKPLPLRGASSHKL